MGASQPEQRSRQSQWILLGAVLVVIVALVFAVSTITSGLRERVENPLNTEPVASAPATEEETTDEEPTEEEDRKSTRLNSSHVAISYAVFCLKKKMKQL